MTAKGKKADAAREFAEARRMDPRLKPTANIPHQKSKRAVGFAPRLSIGHACWLSTLESRSCFVYR
jgi:hypothetical protein